MLGQTSGASFPHQNKKKVHINICLKTLGFQVTAPMFDRSPLDSYL
jgi:hypothetical protein